MTTSAARLIHVPGPLERFGVRLNRPYYLIRPFGWPDTITEAYRILQTIAEIENRPAWDQGCRAR